MDSKSVISVINKSLRYFPVFSFLLGLSLMLFAEQYDKALYNPNIQARRMVKINYSRETRIINWRIMGFVCIGSSLYLFKKGRKGLS